jgi:hypothetical protein
MDNFRVLADEKDDRLARNDRMLIDGLGLFCERVVDPMHPVV